MSFASSNRAALRGVRETVFGVTDATPVFERFRYNSESLNYNISNIVSEEIRDDRMTSDLIQVSADASGDVAMELSYGAYDQYIEGVFAQSAGFSAVQNVAAIDISALDDAGFQAYASVGETLTVFPVGMWVAVQGFANTDLNGFFRVKVSTAGQLTMYRAFIAAESAGASVTLDNGGQIKNGTDLMSFTLQKFLQDATTPTYFNFEGMRAGSMSLDFQTAQILQGTLGFMGLRQVTSTTEITGQTVTDTFNSTPMNGVSNVLDIIVDDAISTANFQSLTLEMNNNLRAQDGIGSLGHLGIALSRLELSGSVGLYFEDSSMYDLYLNGTAFSLSFRVKDTTNNQYIFTLQNVKFESGTVVSGGLDQDVILDATWRAIMDPDTQSMIAIDKFTALDL